MMKTRFSRFLLPISFLAIAVGFAACKGSTDAIVRIKVVEFSVNQLNPQDTVISPVAQAQVRFYQDEKVGTLWLEETILTGPDGVAEYVFANPAILKYDVIAGSRSSLENFIILEQGETYEIEVNLDDL